ncbi:SAM-dependent methyltransferase [Streptomyces sp. NPDC052773]|jgi:SAM-dependent methyltransferase|uniref:SAM-dependent methyltransferase n=1 Tax=Streptomyces sp. NPDC052773 TaxID=3365693 RepID=UPI0037D0A1E2
MNSPLSAGRRPAFDLIRGHVLVSTFAALDMTGSLTRLAEQGLTVEEAGANRFLSEGVFRYLSQRGVLRTDGDRYHLTELGRSLYEDRGYLVWLAGGYSEPLRRFGDLLTGTATYREDVLRDGKWVAVGSALLGKQDVQPEVVKLLGGLEFDRVADIGCGNAHFLITLHDQLGCEGLGIDISPEAVAEARREVEAAGKSGVIDVIEADGSDIASIPGLEDVQLAITFFFLHEVYEKGFDALVDYLRALADRLPAGAHVLAAEVTAAPSSTATDDVFGPEFALVHAVMGQYLLDEEGWARAFTEAGLTVKGLVRPAMPDGLLILAQKAA